VSKNHCLLWVDLVMSVKDPSTSDGFSRLYDVHRTSEIVSLEAEIERQQPVLVCFDFDFPTRKGLETLTRTKQIFPSIPVIMLTVQHSEALAIWAFRSRVWDYLVKPVSAHELDRCLCSLTDIVSLREGQREKRRISHRESGVPEESRANKVRGNAELVLEPAIRHVEKNFRRKISSVAAAKLCNLTPFQFSRSFKETYGLGFQEYVLRFRIREACRLLKNPQAQVTEVGYLVGFNDPSYFSKVFRRYTSFTPSAFCAASGDMLDASQLLKLLSAE